MRKIITLFMVFVLITSCLAGCSPKENNPVEGKKVAYVMYMSSSPIFELWSESFKNTAEALGMEADTFFCEIATRNGKTEFCNVQRTIMTDCWCHMAERIIHGNF